MSSQIQALVQPLLDWFSTCQRILPWRENKDPYRVWVSEIMLQQTRVEAVIPYYNRFLQRLPSIKALADCPEEELLKLWEGLGYYNRVRNLQKAAKVMVEQYGGQFPHSWEQVRALPGIGTTPPAPSVPSPLTSPLRRWTAMCCGYSAESPTITGM